MLKIFSYLNNIHKKVCLLYFIFSCKSSPPSPPPPLEMLKILPFELVNNHISVRNLLFLLYEMSYYVHAHQTSEDQHPSPAQ